jgi:6-pyruvoyltetrahydropterin/6-carboxytetrahydropterin synthase
MKATVIRKSHFNAAHRLHNAKWDDETNRKVYGVCNNPNYHGHNYRLLAHVTGEIDEETGFVMDLKILSEILQKHVEEKLDHKNLNLDVPEFSNLNPTAENIARVIWEIVRKQIDIKYELKITLYETENNWVEYCGHN